MTRTTAWMARLMGIGVLAPRVPGQGSLTPPGAPAPTMRTLDQVEPRTPISALPYVISKSGSYYVTGANGIHVDAHNSIHDCVAVENGETGIDVTDGSTISRCTLARNGGHGIETGAGNSIAGNLSRQSGYATTNGAAIHVTGGDNVLEGNTCLSSDIGVQVTSTGNLIIRNRCSGNTLNFEVVVNNKVAAIVAAPNSPAISGSTGGSGVGSSNAWDNITF